MIIALIALAAFLVMAGVYSVIIRGSLGLVKKRLEEEPDLKKPIADEKLDGDRLPTDIEY